MKNMAVKYLALFVIAILPLLAGCAGLLSKQPVHNTTYHALEMAVPKTQAKPILNTNTHHKLPTVVIYTPKAAAGFDTRRMMYTRHQHQLEYFARNEWIDTPAHMLQALLISTIAQTGNFNAVLAKHSLVKSELRLESEIVKLIQIFSSKLVSSKPAVPSQSIISSKASQLQFILRVSIIDNITDKVVSQQEFSESVATISNDPNGGVLAANQAVNAVLEKMSVFTREAITDWHKPM